MQVLRGLGAGGLHLGGLSDGDPVPATGPAGYCWIPDASGSGYWQRQQVGVPCAFAPPTGSPTDVTTREHAGGSGGGVVVSVARTRRWIATLIAQQIAIMEARRHDTIMALYATGGLQFCKSWSCGIEFQRGNFSLLNPLGVIVELGVAFAPDELAPGFLEKTYVPSPEQQFQADLAVYACSQKYIAKQMADIDLGLVGDFWGSAIYGTGREGLDVPTNINASSSNSKLLGAVSRTRLSVQELLTRFPHYRLTLPGYSLNPDPPTEAELTQPGGLYAYYHRGGYVLTTDCANGVVPAARASITWNEGYCACGQPPGQSVPAAMRNAGGTPVAVFKRAAAEGYGWDTRITIGPQYKIRITPHDAPYWSEAITFMASTMKSIAGFICQNRPLVQQLNNDVLLKEYCFDKANKPCIKGATGCTCTKPTSVQQGAVGVANAAVAKWCSMANDWKKPAPDETPLSPKEPTPPATGAPVWALIGSVAAGIGAGVLAALRRR